MKTLQIIRAAAPIFLASLALGDVSAQARSAYVDINGDGNTVIIQQGSHHLPHSPHPPPHVSWAYTCVTPLGTFPLILRLPRGAGCYVDFGSFWQSGSAF